MPPLKHATLSASSAHRWLECPPSALLEKDMPDESSVHAAEGSAAHEVAEYKVRCYLGEKNLMPPTTGDFDAKEIDRHTDTYLYYVTDRIEEIRNTCPDAQVLVEQRLDYSNYAEGGFGTGDLVIVGDDVLQVIDFKYGQGVPVSAEDNPQMNIKSGKLRNGGLNIMKHIAIRVDDDLFYSTKKYILEQGLSLQTYVSELIKKDLQSKNAYTNFPGNTFKMVDGIVCGRVSLSN